MGNENMTEAFLYSKSAWLPKQCCGALACKSHFWQIQQLKGQRVMRFFPRLLAGGAEILVFPALKAIIISYNVQVRKQLPRGS